MIRRLAVVPLLFALAAPALARVPEWLHTAAATALPQYPADTGGVALLDETLVTVLPNGTLKKTTRRAYRILGTSGRSLAYVAVHFDQQTKLASLRAWAIAANGQQYEVKERDAVETTPFDGALYADNKTKVLTIPAADPGNVVGYEYEQVEQSFGLEDVWYFQSRVPVRRARYVVTLPPGWTHETRWFRAPGVEPLAGAWELSDVPAIESEPRMPPQRAVAGRMAIRFVPPAGSALRAHRTWDDVARWYEGLAAPQRTADPAVVAKARELAAGETTTLGKIAALARFAQHDIRYVAVEIGIGGWRPHAAEYVFRARHGDCKDKVTLLAAMLRAIGVDSHYVLVNTVRGIVDPEFPSYLWFNHAVIAIAMPEDAKDLLATVVHPKLGRVLLFDPTSTPTPFGTLPTYLQQNDALVVGSGGGLLLSLGAHPAEENRLMRSAKLTLREDGSVDGWVREVLTGSLAAAMRTTLRPQSTVARRQYLEERLAHHLAQSTLGEVELENLDDDAKDLVVRYRLAAPYYARAAAGMLLVRPRILGRKVEAISDATKRKNDYVMDGPELHVDEFEIVVPPGLVADELPPPRAITSPALRYNSTTRFEASTLRYHREYTVTRFGVPRSELADLNKAFAEILADERAAAVLVRR